jgi:hypothetical protein
MGVRGYPGMARSMANAEMDSMRTLDGAAIRSRVPVRSVADRVHHS